MEVLLPLGAIALAGLWLITALKPNKLLVWAVLSVVVLLFVGPSSLERRASQDPQSCATPCTLPQAPLWFVLLRTASVEVGLLDLGFGVTCRSVFEEAAHNWRRWAIEVEARTSASCRAGTYNAEMEFVNSGKNLYVAPRAGFVLDWYFDYGLFGYFGSVRWFDDHIDLEPADPREQTIRLTISGTGLREPSGVESGSYYHPAQRPRCPELEDATAPLLTPSK